MADQTFTIPKGWKYTTLGEVADKIVDNRGKTPPVTNSGFELLEVNTISENQRTPDYLKVIKFVDEVTFKNWFRTGIILENDILIPTVGTIGNISFSKKTRGAIAQNLIALRIDTKRSEPLFIYYLLKNPSSKNRLLNLDIGGVQPSIKVPHLLALEILVPPLSEQHAIAMVLSSLDDKIELLREQNKTCEAIAQAIFKEWFVNFNFPGVTGKKIDSELGKIPEGWRVEKLGEVTDLVTKGTTPTTIGSKFVEKGINFIKAESITSGYSFDFSKFSHIDVITNNLLERSKLQEGDLLFTIAGSIGRFAITTKEILPANTNQAVAIIRVKKEFSPYYLMCLLKMSETMSQLLGNVVEAVQANLSLTSIRNLSIVVPDESGIELFRSVCDPFFRKIILNNSQIQVLSTLRDTLLPKLMKGEVRVKGFEN